jgi:demethylmenaquinone methyltransferase/2-methoxy-6-polyprenyl-1,4-benzoquinol methylase
MAFLILGKADVSKLFAIGFGLLLLSGCASYGAIENAPQTEATLAQSYSIKADAGRRGTGDISFRFLNRLKGDGHATVCDMTQAMLDEGARRAAKDAIEYIEWVCGDGMQLPFADRSFDAYTIAFGIRNVTRIEDVLAEAYRVLKPGGRFLCLEFSQIPNTGLQWLYDRYSFNVIPPMGAAVTGDRDSYQYLVESIRKFPDQERFAAMIGAAGFGQVKYRNLTMGVAALHSGWRL